jgi:hypothetical protein
MDLRRCLCLVSALALQMSCATHRAAPPPGPPVGQPPFGRIGLVTARDEPVYQFDAPVMGKDEGASVGAKEGLAACFRPDLGVSAHPIADLVVLVPAMIVCLPVAAAIGSAHGAIVSAPADSIDEFRTRAQQGVNALRLNDAVVQATLTYSESVGLELAPLARDSDGVRPGEAASYPAYASAADSVVEVSVLHVRALSSGRNGVPVAFRLDGRVRVIATADGSVRDDFTVTYRGKTLDANEWLAADGVAVREEMARGVQSIAQQAVDEVMIYRPPARTSATGKPDLVPAYVLRPSDPELRRSSHMGNPFTQAACAGHYQGGATSAGLERYPLISRQPTFQWEALPRDFDRPLGDGPGQAHDVRYDLRIFDSSEPTLAERLSLTYERTGLEQPSHRVAEPLASCGQFRWTVRARFMLDGVMRATEWTGAYAAYFGAVEPQMARRSADAIAAIRAPYPNDPALLFAMILTPSDTGQACECR